MALAAEQPGAKTRVEQLERLPPEGLPPEEHKRPAKPPLHQQQAGEASWSKTCARKDATDCGAPKSKTEYSERVIFGLKMTRRQAIDDVPGVMTKIKHDSPKSKISSLETSWAGCVPVPSTT